MMNPPKSILNEAVNTVDDVSKNEENVEPAKVEVLRVSKSIGASKSNDNLTTPSNRKVSKVPKPLMTPNKSIASATAISRVTSPNRSRPKTATTDTLPARTTKMGVVPDYIEKRKLEISSTPNSTTPSVLSRSSSRPASAIPQNILKQLGTRPAYLNKTDQPPNLSQEFKVKFEKYKALKSNLLNVQRKVIELIMECTSLSKKSGGKINFNETFEMVQFRGAEECSLDKAVPSEICHNVAVIPSCQVEIIKQDYYKAAQKFLAEFRSQMHEGGDQAESTILERFEESLQKINDEHVLTEVSEQKIQEQVPFVIPVQEERAITPQLLQDQEIAFNQKMAEKEQVSLAFKLDAKQKMDTLNARNKDLHKNFTEQTKNVHELKKTIENNENTIKALEGTIKELVNRTKILDGKLSRLSGENQTRLNSESDKTKYLCSEKEQLLKLNHELTEDFKSKVAKLEVEISQLKGSARKQECELNRKMLSKTELSEQKQKLQEIYEDKEHEVKRLMQEILKLSDEKSKFQMEMQLLNENVIKNHEDQMRLKNENEVLAAELKKAQILHNNAVQVREQNSSIEELKREIISLKLAERRVLQENKVLKSKLTSEKRENYTNLNMMQLRGELIKTLQDKDESNKTRIILMMKDQEEYEQDVKKLTMLNCAKEEEYLNMLNTLKSSEIEKEALIYECETYKSELLQYNEKFHRKAMRARADSY